MNMDTDEKYRSVVELRLWGGILSASGAYEQPRDLKGCGGAWASS